MAMWMESEREMEDCLVRTNMGGAGLGSSWPAGELTGREGSLAGVGRRWGRCTGRVGKKEWGIFFFF
jgi:hypothetical protein